jgi:hypothetical protein
VLRKGQDSLLNKRTLKTASINSNQQNNATHPNTPIQKNQSGIPQTLSIPKLTQIKKLALRRGLWYRTLNRLERGIIDLTVQFVSNIRSAKLAQALTAVVNKLKLSTESILSKTVKTYGFSQTQKISTIAQSWGNTHAIQWLNDFNFARYLSIIHLNGVGVYKT